MTENELFAEIRSMVQGASSSHIVDRKIKMEHLDHIIGTIIKSRCSDEYRKEVIHPYVMSFIDAIADQDKYFYTSYAQDIINTEYGDLITHAWLVHWQIFDAVNHLQSSLSDLENSSGRIKTVEIRVYNQYMDVFARFSDIQQWMKGLDKANLKPFKDSSMTIDLGLHSSVYGRGDFMEPTTLNDTMEEFIRNAFDLCDVKSLVFKWDRNQEEMTDEEIIEQQEYLEDLYGICPCEYEIGNDFRTIKEQYIELAQPWRGRFLIDDEHVYLKIRNPSGR